MTRLVALPGFLGRPEDWTEFRETLKELSPETEFQTVELPFKVSGRLPKSMSAWAKKFNQVQKANHVERNILLGYSLGGRLALQAAIDKPGLWDEVVLVSSHPGLSDVEEKAERKLSDADWAKKFREMPWQDVVRLWNGQPIFIGSEEPPRQEAHYDRPSLANALVNWSLADQDFAPDALISLKPKLHWYAGEKDGRYMALFQSMKNEGFIEDVHTVPNAGHRVLFDRPRDLARQLVQDLNL